ncbi:MAG TPA: cupredoxin domain-containing protein [Stellaceae bacterium]|nr:cupredoxin domain-containing protein [Stellaceae bacterium]
MGIAAKQLGLVLGAAGVMGWAGMVLPLFAEDAPISLTIKNHRFDPPELQVPAGVKLRLLVKNLDGTPEEFESHSLHREKVVAGGGEITVFIGPLDPGTYDFFGDFNPTTAQGRIIAK